MNHPTVTLRCQCGKQKEFEGNSATDIMNQIDASGWIDTPGLDYCPECWEEFDDSDLGEPE